MYQSIFDYFLLHILFGSRREPFVKQREDEKWASGLRYIYYNDAISYYEIIQSE